MPNRNTETEFGGNRRVPTLFLLGKRETQQASTSRTVPPSLRNGERFYVLMKALHCFSLVGLQNNHSWHQATQQPGVVTLKFSAHNLFSELHNATRECSGEKNARCRV